MKQKLSSLSFNTRTCRKDGLTFDSRTCRRVLPTSRNGLENSLTPEDFSYCIIHLFSLNCTPAGDGACHCCMVQSSSSILADPFRMVKWCVAVWNKMKTSWNFFRKQKQDLLLYKLRTGRSGRRDLQETRVICEKRVCTKDGGSCQY